MSRTTLLLTFACFTSFAAGCAPGEQSIDAATDPTAIEVEEILNQDDASIDPGEGDRGCDITFQANWSSSTDLVDVETIDLTTMKGTIKGGVYKTFSEPGFILYEPGDSASATVHTDFGCSSQRRWKIYINAVDTDGSSSEVVVYYPSSTSWTTATSINLGNVAAYFD